MTEEAQKPEDMTEAEWAALQGEEGGPGAEETPIAGDDELDAGGETDEQKAEREAAEAAAAAGAAGETEEQKAERLAAEAAAAEAAANEKKQPPPVLISQAPADAEAKLTEITTKKADLATKFDDGELSAKDYQVAMDALNKEERGIEMAVHEANIATKMQAQQARNTFLQEVQTFTDGTLYKQSPLAWEALNAAVKSVGSDPANANLTARQILEKAHADVLKDPVLNSAFASAKQPGKAPGKKPAAEIPPTLGRMPSAEHTDTSGDKFASLDRLFERDPLAYEEAVGKLSASDREAYLARA